MDNDEMIKMEFDKIFNAIKKEVSDKNGYFYFSETAQNLSSLFPLANKIGEHSSEFL